MAYRQGSFLSLLNLTLKSVFCILLHSTVWAALESLPRGSLSSEIWWIRATEMHWLAWKSPAINSLPKISCLSVYQSTVLKQALGWDTFLHNQKGVSCPLGACSWGKQNSGGAKMEMPEVRGHRDGVTVGEHSLKESQQIILQKYTWREYEGSLHNQEMCRQSGNSFVHKFQSPEPRGRHLVWKRNFTNKM